MPVEPPRNIHATALLAGDCGLLITGASGAGKSTLALALIGHFRSLGLFSRLVADDQLFISGHGGRLVCQAPPTIAGLAEVAGIGPQPLAFAELQPEKPKRTRRLNGGAIDVPVLPANRLEIPGAP